MVGIRRSYNKKRNIGGKILDENEQEICALEKTDRLMCEMLTLIECQTRFPGGSR